MLTLARLDTQIEHHALPTDWMSLTFNEFLGQRRKLIAAVIRSAFERISEPGYTASYPLVSETPRDAEPIPSKDSVSISDLFEAGLLSPGTVLVPARDSVDVAAEIDDEGQIVVNDVPFTSPSGAARAATGSSENGWTFWLADTSNGQRPLAALRDEFRNADLTTPSTTND